MVTSCLKRLYDVWHNSVGGEMNNGSWMQSYMVPFVLGKCSDNNNWTLTVIVW